jgi:hypothetical protein
MDLSILIPSIAGLVGGVLLVVFGVRSIRASKKLSHVSKPVAVKPPAPAKPIEEKVKPLTILDIARKHQEWQKGEA